MIEHTAQQLGMPLRNSPIKHVKQCARLAGAAWRKLTAGAQETADRGSSAQLSGRADRRALHMIMHELSEKRERGQREIFLQHPGPRRARLPSVPAGRQATAPGAPAGTARERPQLPRIVAA